jgi:hypothetical protein
VNKLRIVKLFVLTLVAVSALGMGYVEGLHWIGYGHLIPIGLHADIEVHSGSTGIPGVTKTYEAILTNYGVLPASIEKCSYTSDISGIFTKLAYNIERWNSSRGAWETVETLASPDFCTPAPLRMANTRWDHLWLNPGQSLSTEEESTGARGSFRKGDKLRFVIVTEVSVPALNNASYPTQPFTLDEQVIDDGVPYKIRH